MRKLADLIFQRDRLREELSKIEKEISVLTQKTPSLNLPFAHETPKDRAQEKPSYFAPLRKLCKMLDSSQWPLET